MTAQDQPKQVRVRLGQIALELIDGAMEQPALALDQRIKKLRNDTLRLSVLEERDRRQTDALSRLAAAQDRQSKVVSKLFDLVDFRTRELANLFLHISTLVGTKFAEGEELERLHRRLGEIAQDFDKDANALSDIIQVLSRDAERASTGLGRSIEDQQLTVPLQGELMPVTAEKDRGYER